MDIYVFFFENHCHVFADKPSAQNLVLLGQFFETINQFLESPLLVFLALFGIQENYNSIPPRTLF